MIAIVTFFVHWWIFHKIAERKANKVAGKPFGPSIPRMIFFAYIGIALFSVFVTLLGNFWSKGFSSNPAFLFSIAFVFLIIFNSRTKFFGEYASSARSRKPNTLNPKPLRSTVVFPKIPVPTTTLPTVSRTLMTTTAENPVNRTRKLPADGRIKPGWFS